MTTRRKPRPRPVYFETTIPVIRTCRSCGVWLAAGVAEGLKAEVELTTLNDLEIMCAILSKIDLYVLRRSGLIHMDQNRLAGRNLGHLYPQHYCSIRWTPKPSSGVPNTDSNVPPY